LQIGQGLPKAVLGRDLNRPGIAGGYSV
jgi:hypothetical protein